MVIVTVFDTIDAFILERKFAGWRDYDPSRYDYTFERIGAGFTFETNMTEDSAAAFCVSHDVFSYSIEDSVLA